ncbi:MAG: hypothetical protein JXR91_14870 [Deltaproteobacteria bacterium]|nr:hypothetical protein [Deltaproteobacteria bacterium]
MKSGLIIIFTMFFGLQLLGCTSDDAGSSKDDSDSNIIDSESSTDSDSTKSGSDSVVDSDSFADSDSVDDSDSVADSDTGKNIFSKNRVEKSFTDPSNSDVVITPVTFDATVSVDAGDSVNRVLSTVFGNNGVAWRKNTLNNTTLQRHVKNMNMPVMRLPGGNWSNQWLWDGDGTHWALKDNYLDDIQGLPTKTWPMTTDEMFLLSGQLGAVPQVCVNYSLARYIDEADPVLKAAQYAADWVADLKVKGINAEYFEVGNENYGSWQAGYEVGGVQITAKEYGEDFVKFADAMKSANPDIKVGAVIYPEEDGSNVANWTQDVVNAVQDSADYLIAHEYFTWATDLNSITFAQILGAKTKIAEDMENIKKMVEENSDKTIDELPVAMTEFNMRAGEKNTMGVAALFISEALGEFIKAGYGLVNIWDIENGAGFEDHGMFANGETGADDETPHPSFFAYYFYNMMFGDTMVSSSSDDNTVFSYASTFKNGYVGIVTVNEEDKGKNIKLDVSNFNRGTVLYRYEVSFDSLDSRNIYVNGQTAPSGKIYGPDNYEDIPPYEQDITTGDVIIPVKKYSVNFTVIKPSN